MAVGKLQISIDDQEKISSLSSRVLEDRNAGLIGICCRELWLSTPASPACFVPELATQGGSNLVNDYIGELFTMRRLKEDAMV
jgi:hypothetical protein